MCGISGLYLRQGCASRTHITSMNASLSHRGPDDEGTLLDGPVGIGVRRLSIQDPDGGHQPIANEDGRIHAAQNGEIYNFRDLRVQLETLGHRFTTDCDTETLVHAYEEWGGAEFAVHLHGMFAIAIWDSRTRELWLVRDRLGIKPLYVAETKGGLVFGSEVKALLASPFLDLELDPELLTSYFTFGYAGVDRSLAKGVEHLGPGQWMRFDGTRRSSGTYWSLRLPGQLGVTREADAVERVRNQLQQSVSSHLVADVPVGAFLSGGLDSSAIVGLMAESGYRDIRTYSIGFGERGYSELPHAEAVASRWQTRHTSAVVTADDALALLDEMIAHLDEPFADASAIPTWHLARLAARDVKVVLTGDGGDEVFGGYTRYGRALRSAWLDRIPIGLRHSLSRLTDHLPHGFPGRYFLDYAAGDARSRYISETMFMPREMATALVARDWRRSSTGDDEVTLAHRIMSDSGADSLLRECLYLDLHRYLTGDILVKLDRMTMAHGLEARPPMLDHKLVELIMSLPLDFGPSRRPQKHLLKEAVAPVVSDGIRGRTKAGFTVPLGPWFAAPLATVFCDTVLNGGRSAQYLDRRMVQLLFDENRRGRRDHGLRLWAILVFELWLRNLESQRLRKAP